MNKQLRPATWDLLTSQGDTPKFYVLLYIETESMKQAKLIQRLKEMLNSNEVGTDVDTHAELGWPFSSFHMLKTMAEMKSP